ncbi:hypothetical protein [Rhodococcus qingshengii]|uniref:hypothetical protein n=1 Tax=Rhodococcus qingshengii TaxID=334542 RepID=UPI0021091F06|nr:hypothetical protein [Rhodococcus qingshengii]MCQ4148601.1 hypothetical protein [Rhodococcus qingshengii]
MILASETTDLVAAVATSISAVATVIMAAAAVWAAAVAIQTLIANKSDSRDRSRPMVGADLVRDSHPGSRTASLVVRNFGPSVAYNVIVSFQPPLENIKTHSGKAEVLSFITRRYAKPIPNLMPGVELSNVYFVGNVDDDGNTIRNDHDLPDIVTATITYADTPDFSTVEKNQYTETFKLDVGVLTSATYATHNNSAHRLRIRSTKSLEAIAIAAERGAETTAMPK